MSRIFLGKPLHWAVVALLIAISWFIGQERLHVIWFNLFTVILLLASAAAIVAVLLTSKVGERVTRDPLEQDRE